MNKHETAHGIGHETGLKTAHETGLETSHEIGFKTAHETFYDVVVCGGGPAGIAAAVASARTGARTLLIERYGFLGGGATAMLVNPWMTFQAGSRQIIFGVLQELIDRLKEVNAYGCPGCEHAFDPEAFKVVAEQLCLEADVTLLYHTVVCGVRTGTPSTPAADAAAAKVIAAIQVAYPGGVGEFRGKVYVDATGNADVAYLAGATIEKGRPEDGLAQPMTLNFRVGNVEVERMPAWDEISALYVAAKDRGEIDCPREDALWFYTTQPGVIHFNMTRVIRRDATDPWDLTAAEIEARRQMWQIFNFLRRDVSGFEHSYLQQSGPQIGVRESRRVMGEYVLTADDCLQARKFADAIARGSYSIDIHNPNGSGTVIKPIPSGDWYEIPYRCLVPRGMANLLIGGRPISATHEAHSSLRIQPIAIAIGQAAGTAAALAARAGTEPGRVDVRKLQESLIQQGQRFDKPGLDRPE